MKGKGVVDLKVGNGRTNLVGELYAFICHLALTRNGVIEIIKADELSSAPVCLRQ
jgi:hypothetical protein